MGECRSDHEMLNDLAHRVGQGEHWWDDFETGPRLDPGAYGRHLPGIHEDGPHPRGGEVREVQGERLFHPTRKFELYSTKLEEWGYDPLPQFREPPESPVSRRTSTRNYPYILITGAGHPGFFHTENRQLPWLRELHPDPIVEIHPETAARRGSRRATGW